MSEFKLQLLADSDPDFIALRPELRDAIRRCEIAACEAILHGLRLLPAELGELILPLAVDWQREFIRGHLEIYKMLDALWPLLEAEQARQVLASIVLTGTAN